MLLVLRNEPFALLFFVVTIDNDAAIARMLRCGWFSLLFFVIGIYDWFRLPVLFRLAILVLMFAVFLRLVPSMH
jgi:hypothetical protein